MVATFRRTSIYFLGAVFGLVLFFLAHSAHAAVLYLTPPTGIYTIGGTFSAHVKVSSEGASINAAEGIIAYDPTEIQVVNVTRDGSIFNLWTAEPSFSNAEGRIRFGGGTPSGYNGTAGHVVSIVFRAVKESAARVSFASGAVLAADGLGTNVISRMDSASYTLKAGVSQPQPERYVPPSKNTPAAPRISSPTHPDSSIWYAHNDPDFRWSVPGDVEAVRMLVSKRSSAIPTKYYDTPLSKRVLENFDEGAWYFHVQMKNKFGWGEVGTFAFKIDTEDPISFAIKEDPREDLTDPQARFIFKASDKTSGIDHYEIEIDGNRFEAWYDGGSGIYKTPALRPGNKRLTARATDKSGNSLAKTVDFFVEGLPAPKITSYEPELSPGDPVVVKGTVIPSSDVTLFLLEIGNEDESVFGNLEDGLRVPIQQVTVSDDDGNFTAIYGGKLDKGVYEIWVEARDSRGAYTEISDKATIIVSSPAFIRIGEAAIGALSTIVTLIILVLGSIIAVLYLWRRLTHLRKGITEKVHNAFQSLKKDVEDGVSHLDGRDGLSAEEKQINDRLKDALQKAEKHLEENIKKDKN